MNGLLEMMNWWVTGIALVGAFLVSNFDKRGFYLWLVSNSFFTFYSYVNGNYAGAVLFTVYFCITLNGIFKN